MSIKAVLFDLDETLAERFLDSPDTLQRILDKMGIHRSVEEIEKACLVVEKKLQLELEDQRGQMPHLELYRLWGSHFLETLGIVDDGNISREIERQWINVSGIKIYPDVISVLMNLKNKGIKTGIISDGYEEDIQKILKEGNLSEELFDVIVGANTATKSKPYPEAFMYAVRKLDVRPEETIFVGNNLERDYKAAERVGMKSFLIVRSNDQLPEGLRIIKSLMSLMDHLE
ncbi:MAG: HAD family hydrolase [Theionarchaea archaeon]|nr:HAD family hydrolase [Theionarchaea archaeon]